MKYSPDILRLLVVGVLMASILAVAYRPRWLPLLALASVLMWLPVANVQRWNVFHYWLNTKYFQELGYYQLYNCAAAALPEVQSYPARDLKTYEFITAYILPTCNQDTRFTSDRWQEFQSDLKWLQAHGKGPGIEDAIRDKGLNTTPPWLFLSGLLANTRPGSTLFCIGLYADVSALAGAFGVLYATIGARRASLAVITVTTWVGSGAFLTGHWLQWLWVAALIIAMAAWKRGHHGLAGAMIAIASVDRIFPAVLFLWPLLNRRRVDRRFWFAAAWIGGLAVVAGSATPAGLAVWPEFIHKMSQHSAAIATEAGVNVGLRNLAWMVAYPREAFATLSAFAAGRIVPGLPNTVPAWPWLPTAVFGGLGLITIRKRPTLSFGDGLLILFPTVVLSHYYYAWLGLNAAESDQSEAILLLLINLTTAIIAYYALDLLAAYSISQLLLLIYVYKKGTSKWTSYLPTSPLAPA